MRRFLTVSAMTITFLLTGIGLGAQTTGVTERGYPNATDAYQSGMKLYYRTWADLNQAQKHAIANPGDWYRYDVARGQMDLLERTWKDGTFTRAQINEGISELQQILQFNNLTATDRDAVGRDLEHLRDIRINYAH